MDLPPDKAKLLKQYDDEKKWDIICDQVSACLIWTDVDFFQGTTSRYHTCVVQGVPLNVEPATTACHRSSGK
jgi:hypothetical protein